MPADLSREVGLLRMLVRHIEMRPPMPAGRHLTQDFLRNERIAIARETGGGGLVVVRQPAGEAFSELAECLVGRSPAMERGTIFANVRTELLTVLKDSFAGREPATVGEADVALLHAHFDDWFGHLALPRRVFVPCVITPWAAPRFAVGPVSFIFLDEAAASEFYPPTDDVIGRDSFNRMIGSMRDNRAYWLACAHVEGCERQRAEEVGALAVDLAVAGLQLVVPTTWNTTRKMGRLDTRRGAAERLTLSEAGGHWAGGTSWEQPGSVIGTGTLADILRQTAPTVAAVGTVVRSFATGQFRLPNLERAWCDAAYWLHEGLAEPIDAIAVAKLETALEVLLRAESASGSQRRIRTVLQVFYGLEPTDTLHSETTMTAQQFARSFVGDRSRVLHGTWSTLNSRLAVNREGMEGFVLGAIRRAALELEGYACSPTPEDDTDRWLGWVRGREART